MKASTALPLYVDLDGTLMRSDLLLESFLELLKSNLFYLFLVPLWLLRGKAALKHEIASRVTVRVDLLPWNTEFQIPAGSEGTGAPSGADFCRGPAPRGCRGGASRSV